MKKVVGDTDFCSNAISSTKQAPLIAPPNRARRNLERYVATCGAAAKLIGEAEWTKLLDANGNGSGAPVLLG